MAEAIEIPVLTERFLLRAGARRLVSHRQADVKQVKVSRKRMIYHGLLRVVAEVGRRRRLRRFSEFLADELSATSEQETDINEEGDGILMVGKDKEVVEAMAMMVEEALVYSCLASILFTIVWYRIMPNRSIHFMCNWFN